jgi:hypothetical protein
VIGGFLLVSIWARFRFMVLPVLVLESALVLVS